MSARRWRPRRVSLTAPHAPAVTASGDVRLYGATITAHRQPTEVSSLNRILFVCTGNICRSPAVEGIARVRAADAGLLLHFDSAGTHDYHIGEAPDSRTRATARAAGTPVDDLRARQVSLEDFRQFDLILAADHGHLRILQGLQRKATSIAAQQSLAQVELLLPWCGVTAALEVPDPYYGPQAGFVQVQRLLERAVDGLLRRIRAQQAHSGSIDASKNAGGG